jgi:hypothetical protein
MTIPALHLAVRNTIDIESKLDAPFSDRVIYIQWVSLGIIIFQIPLLIVILVFNILYE